MGINFFWQDLSPAALAFNEVVLQARRIQTRSTLTVYHHSHTYFNNPDNPEWRTDIAEFERLLANWRVASAAKITEVK
jgi:hypothetical protein